jgi:hypothetical protein
MKQELPTIHEDLGLLPLRLSPKTHITMILIYFMSLPEYTKYNDISLM